MAENKSFSSQKNPKVLLLIASFLRRPFSSNVYAHKKYIRAKLLSGPQELFLLSVKQQSSKI
jgi:hypothetical protein